MVQPVSYRQLGDILLRMGAITRADLDRALARQASQKREGQFRKLGDILIELGLVGTEEIRKALADQGRTILQCAKCSTLYNVDMYADGELYLCQRCHEPLVFPMSLDKAQVEDWVRSSGKKGNLPAPPEPAAAAVAVAVKPPPRSDLLGHAAEVGSQRRKESSGPARYPKALFGPFEILGEISRGGMGIIYKAHHTKLDRTVAVKVLLHGSKSDAESIERFKLEARAVSRLRHPNIIGIHTIGEIDGIHYFSMDFIEGRTLDRMIDSETITPRQACEIFCQICDAMTYAHSKNVLHRDLKPQNILVDSSNNPMVVDFGIAKLLDQTGKNLTQENEILGSPAYLAPEYVSGKVPKFTESCDVYGAGACLYYTLVGRTPHEASNTVQLLREVAFNEPTPIRRVDRGIDRDLADIVMTAVAREPENRYKSFSAFEHDLRSFLEGGEVVASSGALARWWRRARKPIAAVVGVVLSIALVYLSGVYTTALMETESQRESEVERSRELVNTHIAYCRAMIELERFDQAFTSAQRAQGIARDLESRELEVVAKECMLRIYQVREDDRMVERLKLEIEELRSGGG